HGLRELIESIFDTLADVSQLDVVTLTLVDSDYEIRRVMVDLHMDAADYPTLLFVAHPEMLGALTPLLMKPVLGRFAPQRDACVFPPTVLAPVSIAAIPLRRGGQLIGCLCLGSLHADRFVDGMASDFIEHLGSIIAVCIENVINHERLKRIGLTDALTGVNNRRYLERRLLEEIGRTRRQPFSLACMYIDIDHFKRVNDSAGHQGGDAVLQEVARRIQAELRLSDALGRYGGEEFVVLLIDAQLGHALQVAERIRQSIAQRPISFDQEGELTVTVSIGVTELTRQDRAHPIEKIAQSLIARADGALYRAKEAGRNRVVCSGVPLASAN
ncbi:MAG: sensor domain-containing diguanylate cyclase, partial [Pseudomonadota bacterium]|nr:sensor domain-containing diguanylate cyclase [Pseudomonadota bacterium]